MIVTLLQAGTGKLLSYQQEKQQEYQGRHFGLIRIGGELHGHHF
jgi:hypothetical protein